DGTVVIWPLPSGERLETFSIFDRETFYVPGKVRPRLDFSPTGEWLVVHDKGHGYELLDVVRRRWCPHNEAQRDESEDFVGFTSSDTSFLVNSGGTAQRRELTSRRTFGARTASAAPWGRLVARATQSSDFVIAAWNLMVCDGRS